MKKTLKFTSLLFCLALNGYGQKTYLDLMINRVSTNLYYGSTRQAEFKDFTKSARGIQAGLSFQAGITPAFSVVPELYFIRKGGKLKANNPNSTNEIYLQLNTIELPVLARVHFGKMHLNAGPSIAYNLSGINKIGTVEKEIKFANINGDFRRFEASVQLGGGFEIPIKERRLLIDLRYNHGLSNISFDKEIYNRSFLVSIHFSKAWKKNPLAKNIN